MDIVLLLKAIYQTQQFFDKVIHGQLSSAGRAKYVGKRVPFHRLQPSRGLMVHSSAVFTGARVGKSRKRQGFSQLHSVQPVAQGVLLREGQVLEVTA